MSAKVKYSPISFSDTTKMKFKQIIKNKGVQKILITPEMAQIMLNTNHSKNRDLKRRHIEKYKHIMVSEKWKYNGTTIVFTKNGILIDGQHRLIACVESGVSFITLVVNDVEDDVYSTLDAGTVRTTSDTFKWNGIDDHSAIPQITKKLICLNQKTMRKNLTLDTKSGLADHDCVYEYYKSKEDIFDEMDLSLNFKLINNATVFAVYAYLLQYEDDKKLVHDFFDRFSKGAGLVFGEPVMALQGELQKVFGKTAKTGKPSAKIFATLVAKTFNFHKRKRTSLKAIRWDNDIQFPFHKKHKEKDNFKC